MNANGTGDEETLAAGRSESENSSREKPWTTRRKRRHIIIVMMVDSGSARDHGRRMRRLRFSLCGEKQFIAYPDMHPDLFKCVRFDVECGRSLYGASG